MTRDYSENKKKHNLTYKYDVGDIVGKGTLIIKSKARNKRNEKSYIVQSLVYLDAPMYEVAEPSIVKGSRCGYSTFRRIYEGNSLYSIESIREYLVNIEEAKRLSRHSNKDILCKCPNCEEEKHIKPQHLVSNGLACPNCSTGTSYPELFFMAYINVTRLNFSNQVVFKNANSLRFDFVDHENKIIVETHGEQHYDETCTWYERTRKSDIAKRKWCNENSYTLIELDCRVSEFEFIKDSINSCELLPNITKDMDEKILEFIGNNKRYKFKEIIEMYNKGFSTESIGDKFNMDRTTVTSILKKNDIKVRKSGTYERYDTDKYESIIKLTKEGYTVKEICKKLDILKSLVYSTLKKNGLKPNKRNNVN